MNGSWKRWPMIKYRYTGGGFDGMAAPDLSRDFLVSLYYSMLRIRLIEEAIEAEYHKDEMKSPIHLVIGQEASCVGSCSALRIEDEAFASHRTHGVYLAKGGSLRAMMAELYCRSTGCAGSRGGSMHLFDKSVGMPFSSAICAGPIPIATGAALKVRLRQENKAICVFFGDGAVEEGVTWESINFAVLKKLPIIYFCENNFYSVQSPLDKRQEGTEIHKKALGFGLPSVSIDGNNVLKVYQATGEAALRARRGGGPTFIEAVTYRLRAHGGANDDSHTGYRDVDECEHWQRHCPVELYIRYLGRLGYINESWRSQMILEIKKEIALAFEYAMQSPVPEEEDLYRHVYSV